MKIGLYFGTFNPIHLGHLIIANHVVEHTDLDQVWFVVSPHNPFKKKASLLDDRQRYYMAQLATDSFDKLRASDIEFSLPQPSYTTNTLVYLYEKFPTYSFSLLMGEDNLKGFHKWKNYKSILQYHRLFVYPRISEGKQDDLLKDHPKIIRVNAPIVQISSTFIRTNIKLGKEVRPMLSESVWQYIDQMNFYR